MSKLTEKLDHLAKLHRKNIDMSMDRWRLLNRVGNPQLQLPPVIHVAGTNGKGSTIAFMRAILEAAGLRVHVYTSPHLVTFNERIRLAGELADDEMLLNVFEELEKANEGPITYFEITTAAAFLLFSRVPADVVLLEVGMGGRLDSTNVITPAISVITRISMDHVQFLGDTIEKISAEKAGIIKPDVPCIAAYQADEKVNQVLRAQAHELNAPLYEYGRDFSTEEFPDGFIYRTSNMEHKFPLPALLGAHQILNAATAITAAKLFTKTADENIHAGLESVEWPGRLQRITAGPIAALLPIDTEIWYDGAHNDSGAEALAEQCRRWRAQGYEIHLVLGMLATKDPAVFKDILQLAKTISTIPVPDGGPSNGYSAADLAKKISNLTDLPIHAAPSIPAAIQDIVVKIKPKRRQSILICGSLHLAQALES